MQKSKRYKFTFFTPNVIREASELLAEQVDPSNELEHFFILECTVDEDTEWSHDSTNAFFTDYRRMPDSAAYNEYLRDSETYEDKCQLQVWYDNHRDRTTNVTVSADDRETLDQVFELFESHLEESQLPDDNSSRRPRVFIGHGGSTLWRDLKDHLQDQHGYEIEAYEVGARAGHGIRDILEQMLDDSTFAILVLTGEDETIESQMHPRLNVVHELGLFQARLGFGRAIALLENGALEFSNLRGIQQVRFSEGNIRETYGDVLATLRREFSQSA